MPQANNPAGRLYAILAEAKQTQDNVQLKTMWAKMFDVAPDDTAGLLAFFVQVMGLVAQTRRAIESLTDVDKDAYLRPIVQIERAFTRANFETHCAEFKGIINDSVMVALDFCSDKLSRVAAEEMIDATVLRELLSDVQDMIEEILGSTMDASLKAVILDHLEAIRRAILQYKISGAEGIKRAMDSGVGSLLRHADELKKSDNKSKVERLTKLLAKIDGYVTFGVGAKKLFGHAMELLQLGN
jgi:hypothetical protein